LRFLTQFAASLQLLCRRKNFSPPRREGAKTQM
jgi:hypothetical protein